MATAAWRARELGLIGGAEELDIAVNGIDEEPQRWVPIWVVCSGGQVYVRTWHRRETGWFGHVLSSGRARIRVPGLEKGVEVEDIGGDNTEIRDGIDASYRGKYGHYGVSSVDRMLTDEAAAATLRLIPVHGAPDSLGNSEPYASR